MDKDKIKFAIRYLKQGLKSKRTPPLYEELMKELGFVKKDKVNNLSSVAEVRLANCQKYEKAYNETEELLAKQIEATYKVVEENKELKEKLKPENCLKLLAKEGYITFSSDKLTKAKEIIKDFLSLGIFGIFKGTTAEEIVTKAEQFLKECE